MTTKGPGENCKSSKKPSHSPKTAKTTVTHRISKPSGGKNKKDGKNGKDSPKPSIGTTVFHRSPKSRHMEKRHFSFNLRQIKRNNDKKNLKFI
uniref:Ovule protein n=1 Tax=Strongyloides papillosus TaxID=174720 RepID=A0A0N5CIA2_STREA